MAKAPSESRIPTFGSRIPIPGKLRLEKKEQHTYNVNTTTVISQNNITRDKNIDGNCTIVLDTNSAEATFVLNNSSTTSKSSEQPSPKQQVAPHRGEGIIQKHVGKRVCVGNEQTGVLHFVGEVHFTAGVWCGVELDEPIGKHDGLVKGVRYFTCRAGCGVMAPVSKVSIAHDNNNKTCDINSTKVLSKNIEADQNLTAIINPDTASRNKCRHSIVLSGNSGAQSFKFWNTNKLNETITSPLGELSFCCNLASTPSASNRHTRIISPANSDLSINRTLDLKINTTITTNTNTNTNTNNSPSCCSPVETPSLTKQNSFELDESLGILTPDQMIDISNFVKNSKTMSSDDLKAILIPKRNEISLASSRTSSSENIVSLPKESSNSLTPVDVQSVRGIDESSLAILTPDQMADYSVFVDATMKTPSSLEDQRSDKTISNSRTPSSENLGSMAKEGFKMPPHPILLECENSTSISRPLSIDLKPPQEDVLSKTMKLPATSVQADISSPNAVENSIIDFSLGLIEEDLLATGNQFSSMIDTTTNLELPLDSISGECKIEEFKSMSRSDQTPSPEDLPLDPIDPIKSVELEIIEPILLNPSADSDPKTDPSKSTTTTKTNSFITSVTSITSLDTGYQGDGEMSRPASRGADHSPMAHKPNNPALVNLQWQRAIARRQDPMTDSDFFTESDADNHDENVPKGDRRAQVIDGTLYGINNQAAAAAQDIFIANQEEMDSSGVFTDLEMNNRADDYSDGERNRMEVVPTEDKSPSDISTKSITENSQEIKEPEDMDSTLVNQNQADVTLVSEQTIEKPKSPTQSIISTTSSRKSQRTRTPLSKEENPSKKLKMPKRNVTSKVKSMMEHKQVELENQENRKPARKPVGRWDAVMNKISKGQEENKSKLRLKEVKSKVATGITGAVNTTNKRSETRKFTPEESLASKAKIRRIRARDESLAGSKPTSRTASSIHSSLSDLSVGLSSTSNKQVLPHAVINRVNKKREVGRCATPVTEVLTPNGHKPTPVTSSRTTTTSQQKTTREIKKSSTLPVNSAPDGKTIAGRRAPSGRNVGAATLKASSLATVVNKDQSRVTGVTAQKGGSPVRNQVLQEKTQVANLLLPHVKHSAKGVEALGVLVQYLVFNLDAFRTPSLKRELESIRTQWIKDKLELEETRMGYRRLEDAVSEQKVLAAQTLEEERVKYRAEITELFEKHRRDLGELNNKNSHEKLELERRYEDENSELKNQLDAEISNREHEISVRIEAYVTEHSYRLQELEQENEKLRRDNQMAVEILREENDSIREQLDEKTNLIEDLKELRFVNEKLKDELRNKEKLFEEKVIAAQDEIALLKEENKKILETFKSDTKDNKLQNGYPEKEKCSVVPQAALGRCTQLQDEVESLRTVLDLKLAELSELRRAHGELSQAAEELPAALLRAQTLQARVEDLELQLERKTEIELQLTKENKRLQESFNQESKQNKRLSLHNEELQWKLKQNSEVVNAIILQGQSQSQSQTPNRKPLHGSNQSLCDEMSLKCSPGGYLNRSHHTSSFNEKHHGTFNTSTTTFTTNANATPSPTPNANTSHILERTLSFRERTSHFLKDNKSPSRKSESSCTSSCNKSDYFELEDSPPSSPKVKGVVEKSDSVSWVLDMDESPEVIASRMVRRAGSFRNVTPPKSTPTKSPATKRPRTKSNNLSLSASAGAIITSDDSKDNRHRSKSVTLRDTHSQAQSQSQSQSQSPESNCHPGEYLSNSWHYSLRTSTPNNKGGIGASAGMETIRNGGGVAIELENNPDLEHDSDVAISLPALPSQIHQLPKPDSLPSLPSGDLLLLQSSFPPKNAAGEAMISESNSEDDECSSSTSERSPSVSDTETSEGERTSGVGSCGVGSTGKPSKMQYDLFLLTESTTNSEAMDCSWSEELDVV